MTAYGSSTVKRSRATVAEIEHRRKVLVELARDNRPLSIRNLYYVAVVAGVVPKTQNGYQRVVRDASELRRAGVIPYGWFVDNTRRRRTAGTWRDLAEMIDVETSCYRKALWTDAAVTVEVWCESESIAGVIEPVTREWDVPLLPTRGYSSLTFAHDAVGELNRQGRPAVVFYVGDHDPHGLDIERQLRDYLTEWATVPLTFTRLALTWAQVEELDLPGDRPKTTRNYPYPRAVEAEAVPPPMMRELVADAITTHVDFDDLARIRAEEADERAALVELAGRFGR